MNPAPNSTPEENTGKETCFWPTGCSDGKRCSDFGQCVAQFQHDALTIKHPPARGPDSFTADGYKLMHPDTQRALGVMVKQVLANERSAIQATASPVTPPEPAIAAAREANKSLEARAIIFSRETGMTAPFKDSRDGAFSLEEREQAWAEWNKKYSVSLESENMHGLHEVVRLRAELERLREENRDLRIDRERARDGGNRLYAAIVERMQPHFDEASRDLDWDVLPGTISRVCSDLQAAKTRVAELERVLRRERAENMTLQKGAPIGAFESFAVAQVRRIDAALAAHQVSKEKTSANQE